MVNSSTIHPVSLGRGTNGEKSATSVLVIEGPAQNCAAYSNPKEKVGKQLTKYGRNILYAVLETHFYASFWGVLFTPYPSISKPFLLRCSTSSPAPCLVLKPSFELVLSACRVHGGRNPQWYHSVSSEFPA